MSSLFKSLEERHQGAPMGDSELGVLADHLAVSFNDPALGPSLRSRLLEAINDSILCSPNDYRARFQAMGASDPTSMYHGIPISFLIAAIALNAIPNIGLAAAIYSSADNIIGRIARVLEKASCMKPGEGSALSDDWVVDDFEFDTDTEPGGI
ncbi:hypothetical protein BDV93DRAFT_524501 [Ceratobasidium sp. AG-I]|nr:hypothetical protein BDV93DRAFT_524501 [Ceratobasidium sp. AG-I]